MHKGTGFVGKTLWVDLSTGRLKTEPLEMDWARQFVGGSGLSARYIWELTTPDTDPLGSDNPLVFMTGPLTGTRAPSCGRYVVCARSPLTGIWGEANAGGDFGPMLKFAGFDALIITGRSEKPVSLWIHEGQAELLEAGTLWGLDTYTTQEQFKSQLGAPKASVACIGQAGENGVLFAAVMNDAGRAAGRCGMGTVMGAKKLKAVAVAGSEEPDVADPETLEAARREALETLKGDFSVQVLRELGTAGSAETFMMLGDMPVRYFTQGETDIVERISGSAMADSILVKNAACFRCPIACGRVTRLSSDSYQLPRVDGPEYETVAAFGTLLMVDDLEAITYLNHLSNAYGLDTISAGVTIALAYYLFDQGVISLADTGGLELRWGDPKPAIQLIRQMAQQEGFGQLLAKGSRALARRYGVEELAAQCNGLEMPMHDPRATVAMGLNYATSPRGACHNQGDMYLVDQGLAVPELGITFGDRFESSAEKAAITARQQNWRTLYGSLVMCVFCNPGVKAVRGLLSGATGWELESGDLLILGERGFTLKRLLNLRWGLTGADDRLPPHLLKPLPDGGTEGRVPDMETLLAGYYQARGWDPKTGQPFPQTLERLGLSSLLTSRCS